MFIAMNRFKVQPGEEEAFEAVWKNRDSHLNGVPGFVGFHMLRGQSEDDHTLFASHTVWETRETFEAWTRSDAFRKAHANAGEHKPLYIDRPRLELFETIQEVLPEDA